MRAKFQIIRVKERKEPNDILRCQNGHRIYEAVFRKYLETRLSIIENASVFEKFRAYVLECVAETLGYVTAKHRDKFNENNVRVMRLLVSKRLAHNMLHYRGLLDVQ